jgi:hypothetical protein
MVYSEKCLIDIILTCIWARGRSKTFNGLFELAQPKKFV